MGDRSGAGLMVVPLPLTIQVKNDLRWKRFPQL